MRNVESRFATNPTTLDIGRSRFARPKKVWTSFNAGELIPFFCSEVIPGDSFQVSDSKVVRMSTLLSPLMDEIYLDTYYFFCPSRLVWNHWKNFMGENTASAWIPQVTYTIPQVTAPSGGWTEGTLADYFGVPTKVSDLSINALPFRCYSLICNEWFRDENLTDPIFWLDGDTTLAGSNGNSDSDIPKGGMPFKVSKYHDLFSSCLPGPQKAADTLLPLGTVAPVVSLPETHSSRVGVAAHIVNPATGLPYSGEGFEHGIQLSAAANGNAFGSTRSTDGSTSNYYTYDNLWAALDQATAASINQLRLAFQIQKLYERDARSGSRYTEVIRAHFSVTSPDARLQRPEYLGGSRKPINISQVIQNSETSSTSPLGNTAGWSCTIDSERAFTKSFTEHGYIIGLMCARYDHSYQQGLERMWTRKGRFDFYWPALANIGETPILNSQIYAQGSSVLNPVSNVPYDDEVFGYQEAWAEYRYDVNMATGQMRSNAQTSLNIWHLADDYSQLPSLSDSWIREDKVNIDRVLAVTSAVSHQFFANIFINNVAIRPMPVYSVPGLIDHH